MSKECVGIAKKCTETTGPENSKKSYRYDLTGAKCPTWQRWRLVARWTANVRNGHQRGQLGPARRIRSSRRHISWVFPAALLLPVPDWWRGTAADLRGRLDGSGRFGRPTARQDRAGQGVLAAQKEAHFGGQQGGNFAAFTSRLRTRVRNLNEKLRKEWGHIDAAVTGFRITTESLIQTETNSFFNFPVEIIETTIPAFAYFCLRSITR